MAVSRWVVLTRVTNATRTATRHSNVTAIMRSRWSDSASFWIDRSLHIYGIAVFQIASRNRTGITIAKSLCAVPGSEEMRQRNRSVAASQDLSDSSKGTITRSRRFRSPDRLRRSTNVRDVPGRHNLCTMEDYPYGFSRAKSLSSS